MINSDGGELFQFRFELDQIGDIQPWGEPGNARLHWFGLTSGRYWIETPAGEVFRYTPEIGKVWNSPFPYADYQVARMLEDLQDHLPAALEPVPDDIAGLGTSCDWLRRVHVWIEEECSDQEGRDRWDLYERAMYWWWQREIDTGHLGFGPRISTWRTNDLVHFRWATRANEERGVSVFVNPDGEFTTDVAKFQSAVLGFCDEVLRSMRYRVEEILTTGWKRTDCTVDLAALAAEQTLREERLARVRQEVCVTDWSGVRAQLRELVTRVGSI